MELARPFHFPTLERKPGKQNWVDRTGGLPEYIDRVARHIHYTRGKSISRAIRIAVGTIRDWAAGRRGASPKTQAKAARAIAQWDANRARAKAMSDESFAVELARPVEVAWNQRVLELADPDPPYEFYHGWIPRTPAVAQRYGIRYDPLAARAGARLEQSREALERAKASRSTRPAHVSNLEADVRQREKALARYAHEPEIRSQIAQAGREPAARESESPTSQIRGLAEKMRRPAGGQREETAVEEPATWQRQRRQRGMSTGLNTSAQLRQLTDDELQQEHDYQIQQMHGAQLGSSRFATRRIEEHAAAARRATAVQRERRQLSERDPRELNDEELDNQVEFGRQIYGPGQSERMDALYAEQRRRRNARLSSTGSERSATTERGQLSERDPRDLDTLAAQVFSPTTEERSSRLPSEISSTSVPARNLAYYSDNIRSTANTAREISVNGEVLGTIQRGKIGSFEMRGRIRTGRWISQDSGYLVFDNRGRRIGASMPARNQAEGISQLLRHYAEQRRRSAARTSESDRDVKTRRVLDNLSQTVPDHVSIELDNGERLNEAWITRHPFDDDIVRIYDRHPDTGATPLAVPRNQVRRIDDPELPSRAVASQRIGSESQAAKPMQIDRGVSSLNEGQSMIVDGRIRVTKTADGWQIVDTVSGGSRTYTNRQRKKAIGYTRFLQGTAPSDWQFAGENMAIELRNVTIDERRRLRRQGKAMSDLSYPIGDGRQGVTDLKNAIMAYGRANPGKRAALRRHILENARRLGKSGGWDALNSWARGGGRG